MGHGACLTPSSGARFSSKFSRKQNFCMVIVCKILTSNTFICGLLNINVLFEIAI